MVDFPEGIKLLGMCTGKGDLRIGMEVETTVGKLYEDGENEYIVYLLSKGEVVSAVASLSS